MGQMVGYCRVSSSSQSLTVQLDELKAAGCTKVFSEKTSGRFSDNRPELKACLEYVREGDTLVISRLDRMARSVLDLASIADRLHKKGVNLRVVHQGIDTSTAEGKLLFGILSTFAAFELDIRSERQRQGIDAALKAGVKFGRKPSLTEEQAAIIRRLRREEGFAVGQLQSRFHVSRATVYRALAA